jgi:hypothetical protein
MDVSRWNVWTDPQCPGSLTYAFEQLEQISTGPFGNVLRIYLCMGRHHILQSRRREGKEDKLVQSGRLKLK